MRTEYVTEYRYPPDSLIQDCPMPSFTGHTMGDAIDYIPRLIEALESCNADKRAMRAWKGGE